MSAQELFSVVFIGTLLQLYWDRSELYCLLVRCRSVILYWCVIGTSLVRHRYVIATLLVRHRYVIAPLLVRYRYVIGRRSDLDRGCPIYGASPSGEAAALTVQYLSRAQS